MRDPGPVQILFLVPALNEEEALSLLLPTIGDAVRQVDEKAVFQVVVVDNGSSDSTSAVSRAHGAVVVHEAQHGYGAACLAGLAHAKKALSPPRWVVFLDADHGPLGQELGSILAPLFREEAQLVLGVRQGHPGERRPLHARWGTTLMLGMSRFLGGGDHTDLPPFRAITWSVLEALEMDDRTWGWTIQMQVRAHRAGIRVVEVPVNHRPRLAGRSKISGSLSTSLKVGWVMFTTLLRERGRPGSPGWRPELPGAAPPGEGDRIPSIPRDLPSE